MKSFSPIKEYFKQDVERLAKLFPELNFTIGYTCYEVQGDIELVQQFERKLWQFVSYQERLEKYLDGKFNAKYQLRSRKYVDYISH